MNYVHTRGPDSPTGADFARWLPLVDTTMADTAVQPRTRHLVAVSALLFSSVGGFAPPTYRRIHHPNIAVAPAESGAAVSSPLLRSRRTPLHRGQQRGEWVGIGEQRWPGALRGQGLAVGEASEQQPTSNKSFFVGSGGSGGARGCWRREPRRSGSATMALHFPKPPKMPKPPPPPPTSGDKTPAGGKPAGSREASSSLTSAGSTGGSRTLNGAAASSTKAEGVVDVPGLVAKTRNVSAGHGNVTRTDLNGGKVSQQATEFENSTKTRRERCMYVCLRNAVGWGGRSTSTGPGTRHQVFRVDVCIYINMYCSWTTESVNLVVGPRRVSTDRYSARSTWSVLAHVSARCMLLLCLLKVLIMYS